MNTRYVFGDSILTFLLFRCCISFKVKYNNLIFVFKYINSRFRKYFIRVLMFLPRIFCGKNLGRDWECQKTNNTLQLKQLNGASNFNSQLSNINDVHGRSNGHPSLSHSNLARSRSMKEGLEKDTKRDVTFQSGFGNSLFPQRQSRLTSSCVS